MVVDHALDLGPFPELLPYFDLVASVKVVVGSILSAELAGHLVPSTMRLVVRVALPVGT